MWLFLVATIAFASFADAGYLYNAPSVPYKVPRHHHHSNIHQAHSPRIHDVKIVQGAKAGEKSILYSVSYKDYIYLKQDNGVNYNAQPHHSSPNYNGGILASQNIQTNVGHSHNGYAGYTQPLTPTVNFNNNYRHSYVLPATNTQNHHQHAVTNVNNVGTNIGYTHANHLPSTASYSNSYVQSSQAGVHDNTRYTQTVTAPDVNNYNGYSQISGTQTPTANLNNVYPQAVSPAGGSNLNKGYTNTLTTSSNDGYSQALPQTATYLNPHYSQTAQANTHLEHAYSQTGQASAPVNYGYSQTSQASAHFDHGYSQIAQANTPLDHEYSKTAQNVGYSYAGPNSGSSNNGYSHVAQASVSQHNGYNQAIEGNSALNNGYNQDTNVNSDYTNNQYTQTVLASAGSNPNTGYIQSSSSSIANTLNNGYDQGFTSTGSANLNTAYELSATSSAIANNPVNQPTVAGSSSTGYAQTSSGPTHIDLNPGNTQLATSSLNDGFTQTLTTAIDDLNSGVGDNSLNAASNPSPKSLPSNPPVTPIIHKHIYFHVPPPEIEEPVTPAPPPPPPKKNYKILFIKVPSQEPKSNLARLQQQITQMQNTVEEKTLVYVLVKNPEEPKPVVLPEPKPSEHQVYFVKYAGNPFDIASQVNDELDKTGSVKSIVPLEPGLVNGQHK